MSLSSSLISSYVNGKRLPYDVVNIILEYLETDAGWRLTLAPSGKLRLFVNPAFTGICDIVRFKSKYYARYVQLKVQKWDSFHNADSDDQLYQMVTAIEEPHRIHTQSIIDAHYRAGYVCDNRCYKYTDPSSGLNMIAYVELRNYLNGSRVFQQGCVYDEHGDTMVVSGFETDETNTRIVVNPLNMIWDYDGVLDWPDYLEEADAGMMENSDFEIDLDALPPLQMYM
jgi:hypothetical protein